MTQRLKDALKLWITQTESRLPVETPLNQVDDQVVTADLLDAIDQEPEK